MIRRIIIQTPSFKGFKKKTIANLRTVINTIDNARSPSLKQIRKAIVKTTRFARREVANVIRPNG